MAPPPPPPPPPPPHSASAGLPPPPLPPSRLPQRQPSSPEPLFSDEEFQTLINVTKLKDAVKDAAIDVFSARLWDNGIRDIPWVNYDLMLMDDATQKLSTIKFESEEEQAVYDECLQELFSSVNSDLPRTEITASDDIPGPEQDEKLYVRALRRHVLFIHNAVTCNDNVDAADFAAAVAKANPMPDAPQTSTWPVPPPARPDNITKNAAALQEISASLHSISAVGGRISISSDQQGPGFSHSVQVSWSDQATSTRQYVELPPQTEDADSTTSSISELGGSCFDSSQVLTDFSPHNNGILSCVRKILVPGTCRSEQIHLPEIRADLSYMSIHASSSEKARQSAATSNDSQSFGVLIVILPCEFQGGVITVRNDQQTAVFDTSHDSAGSISWVALTNTCQYEISQVTSGQQCSLVYKLSWTVAKSNLLIQPPLPGMGDISTLPVYQTLKSLLEDPEFLRDGAVLGVFSAHKYLHNSFDSQETAIQSLKGQDLLVYLAFKSLGLQTALAPALRAKMQLQGYTYGGHSLESLSAGVHANVSTDQHEALVGFQRTGNLEPKKLDKAMAINEFKLTYEGEDIDGPNNPSTVKYERTFEERRRALSQRKVLGLDRTSELVTATTIGKEFSELAIFPDVVEEEHEYTAMLLALFPHTRINHVLWLNEPAEANEAGQLGVMMFGNEPLMEVLRSSVVQLVVIPPARERLPISSSK